MDLDRPNMINASPRGRRTHWVLLICVSLACLGVACEEDVKTDTHELQLSEEGHFRVRAKCRTASIPLHELHEWIVHVETAEGRELEQATIGIEGGMPEHQHGLPTVPIMTRSLGNGDFLIEGMKFSMDGHWTLSFDIAAEGKHDRVTFNLQL